MIQIQRSLLSSSFKGLIALFLLAVLLTGTDPILANSLEQSDAVPAQRLNQPSAVQVLPPDEISSPSNNPQVAVDYLILTTTLIRANSNIEAYADFMTEHGYNVFIQDVGELYLYPGFTRADRIRSYLQSVYLAWGLKYVLLVGDPRVATGDVPMKDTWPNHLTNAQPTTKNPWEMVPTDAYFSNLTGNWDLNGNGYAGEAEGNGQAGDIGSGGLNFYPDVSVGRIPVYNADYAALNHILDKLIAYQSITQRQAWQNKALFPMVYNNPTYDEAVMGYVLDTNLMAPNGISSYRIYMNHPDL